MKKTCANGVAAILESNAKKTDRQSNLKLDAKTHLPVGHEATGLPASLLGWPLVATRRLARCPGCHPSPCPPAPPGAPGADSTAH